MRGPRLRIAAGPAALVLILLLAAAAPWLAPRPPDLQEDVAGARYLAPFTRAVALQIDADHVRIGTSPRPTAGGWEYTRAGRRERVDATDLPEPPSPRFYLLGTDGLGWDLASRLLYGARHSVGIAALGALLALLLGVGVGSAAGLAGGWADALLMRGVDVLRSVPRLLVYLLCATLFRPSTVLLVLVLGATTWTELARLVRIEMLALRRSDLASAPRASGASPARILGRHLLPQIAPLLVVSAALRFADTVLLESALSLLGLGSPPPAVSLGGLIASGREALAEAWWIVAWPGALISLLVVALRSTASRLVGASDPPSLA